jgi:hypothetical protein
LLCRRLDSLAPLVILPVVTVFISPPAAAGIILAVSFLIIGYRIGPGVIVTVVLGLGAKAVLVEIGRRPEKMILVVGGKAHRG